jgi:hypothetical protein
MDEQPDWRQAQEAEEHEQFLEDLCKRFETGLYNDDDLRAMRSELLGART